MIDRKMMLFTVGAYRIELIMESSLETQSLAVKVFAASCTTKGAKFFSWDYYIFFVLYTSFCFGTNLLQGCML